MLQTQLLTGPIDLGALGDDELIAHVQVGGGAAFGELYDRYRQRAHRVSQSVCRDDGRAQEAVQEAFVSIWLGRATYLPERGTVAAWLLTVVRHRAIDVSRRNHRHAARRVTDDRLDELPADDDLAARVHERAGDPRLAPLLAQIPDAQRQVIVLAFFEELTHAEIARQLGLPSGTVKGRMRLGLDKLRTELQRSPAA